MTKGTSSGGVSRAGSVAVVLIASLIGVGGLALGGAGCRHDTDPAGEAPAAANAAAPKEPYRPGRIRLGDQLIKVVPNIHHPAEMDLFVGCQRVVGETPEGQEKPPLCYGSTKRSGAPKVLRIEHRESMPSGEALEHLRLLHESSHFVVDKSGAIYQSLDLVWPVRRAGAIQPDEIRVLSGSAKGHQTLFAALAETYPDLHVEVVAGPPERPAAERPKPPLPGMPAPGGAAQPAAHPVPGVPSAGEAAVPGAVPESPASAPGKGATGHDR